MKKTVVPLFQAAVLISVFFSCGNKEGNNIRENIRPGEGWVDNDTYRISAPGKSVRTDNLPEKIVSAERAAVKNAREELIERFNLRSSGYMDLNNNPTEVGLRNELFEIIESGKVIERYYDNKKEMCKILYEIRSTGLKQKVETVN